MKTVQFHVPSVYSTLVSIAHVFSVIFSAHACMFPDFLQWQEGDNDFNWYTGIRHNRTRETVYSIRHNIIDITSSTSAIRPKRWKCISADHGKYLVKRMDLDTSVEFRACVKFIRRSTSIVQMMWSKESDSTDRRLCEDRNLRLDPWLLVSFYLVMDDYAPSPFRGGFSMRTTDSETGENSCNYMHRPMKFESDCLTGEGIIFDFMSKDCLPSTTLAIKQRTLTVANWQHKGDYFVVLRGQDVEDLFCLRMPMTEESHMNAFLFRDLACLTQRPTSLLNIPTPTGVSYLVLHLQRYVYSRLCDDEYPQCTAVSCDGHVRHECHKSCQVCDSSTMPDSCTFPKRFRDQWYQTNKNGLSRINITESDFTIQNVGHFRCVSYPDSPPRRSRMFTTISMFEDGCRPRYTCIKIKRLGPDVLRYTLSQSFVWPELETDFGQAICADERFREDPGPIYDLYRSQEDTGKPIISYNPSLQGVACNLSSSFSFTTTLANGSLCYGKLFEHCEDNTRLRLQFHAGCGRVLDSGETFMAPYRAEPEPYSGPSSMDYTCLAHFEGHYWEKMVMLQNVQDLKDSRCLVFTQMDVSQALVVHSGECDKNSWHYVRDGFRDPILFLELRPEVLPCQYLPVTTTHGGRHGYSLDNPHLPPSPPFISTLPPGSHPHSSADYEKEGREGIRVGPEAVLSPNGGARLFPAEVVLLSVVVPVVVVEVMVGERGLGVGWSTR